MLSTRRADGRRCIGELPSRFVGLREVVDPSISVQRALRRCKPSFATLYSLARAHLSPLSQNIAAARLLLTRDDVDARLKDHEGALRSL